MALDPAKRKAMGAAAHDIVRNDYDVEIAGPKIEAILAEAARIKNRPLLGFVAGMLREELAPASLRAKRSNPAARRQARKKLRCRLPRPPRFFCLRASRALDCFVASLLAMTH